MALLGIAAQPTCYVLHVKKDPLKALNERYLQKLEEAMRAQRNGDIRSYSMLTSEAEDILMRIEASDKTTKS